MRNDIISTAVIRQVRSCSANQEGKLRVTAHESRLLHSCWEPWLGLHPGLREVLGPRRALPGLAFQSLGHRPPRFRPAVHPRPRLCQNPTLWLGCHWSFSGASMSSHTAGFSEAVIHLGTQTIFDVCRQTRPQGLIEEVPLLPLISVCQPYPFWLPVGFNLQESQALASLGNHSST